MGAHDSQLLANRCIAVERHLRLLEKCLSHNASDFHL